MGVKAFETNGRFARWLVFFAVLLMPFLLYCLGIIVLGSLKVLLVIFVGFFVILPIAFRFSHTLQRSIIFLNFIQWPRNVDYWQPWILGLRGARNLRIHSEDKITLGVWHMLPEMYINDTKVEEVVYENNPQRDEVFDSYLLNTDQAVILYAHGNSNSRAASHRIELYKLLQHMHFHVIAFDYRSYGDSSNEEPSEEGLVEDTLAIYKWILSKINPNRGLASSRRAPVYLWGHSLGTGVSTHVVHNLYSLGNNVIQQPAGLILESPFNCMQEEIYVHPFSKLFSWLPYYRITVADALDRPGLRFESSKHICAVRDIPLLVLHAKDDKVVPYNLGLKLYTEVKRSRKYDKKAAEMEMRSYSALEKYGHKYIVRAPDLSYISGTFVSRNLPKKPYRLADDGLSIIPNVA